MKHVERHFCYLCRFFVAYFWARLYCTCHTTDMGSSNILTHTYTSFDAYFEYFMPVLQYKSTLFVGECKATKRGSVDEWQVVCCFCHFTVAVFLFCCSMLLFLFWLRSSDVCLKRYHRCFSARTFSHSALVTLCARIVCCLLFVVNVSFSFVLFDAWTKFMCDL